MNKLYVYLFLSLFFIGCENKEDKIRITELEKQVFNYEKEIVELKSEIEKYKTSPDKLYAQAEELYKNKDLMGLSKLMLDLKNYHPESKETKEVGKMISAIEKEQADNREREAKARLQAVNKLKKTHDDVANVTWYLNPYFTHYNDDNRTSIYIGKNSSSVWLRLKMSYGGEDWIFFKNAYLSYDGNTREFLFDEYNDKKSDNSGYGVWEWIDVMLSDSDIRFLEGFVNAKEPKMRLSGKYTKTRVLSQSEIKALKDVLLAYDVLKFEK